jgi:sec-independent protein translocase protein TatA
MSLFGFLTNPMELMVVALIALLFFGNRLPSVMRSLGRGVVEFKKGVAGIEDEVDNAAAPKKQPEQKAVDGETGEAKV